jgi:hypothetical protein
MHRLTGITRWGFLGEMKTNQQLQDELLDAQRMIEKLKAELTKALDALVVAHKTYTQKAA